MGVFCRLFYPWMHQVAARSNLLPRLRLPGLLDETHSRRVVTIKTIADQVPFLALQAASLTTLGLLPDSLDQKATLGTTWPALSPSPHHSLTLSPPLSLLCPLCVHSPFQPHPQA